METAGEKTAEEEEEMVSFQMDFHICSFGCVPSLESSVCLNAALVH